MVQQTPATAPRVLSQETLPLDLITAIARRYQPVALSGDPAFRARLWRGRDVLERKLACGEVVYGVNTGYGGNARFVIPQEDVARHQQNLLEFLACGFGEPLPEAIVRAAILLRANALSRGLSAVRPAVIERLLDMLNHRITPLVPRFGSVGASGDLCPSAYIARVLEGRGMALYRGERVPAADALRHAGIEPLTLLAKEGLALLNGTTVMTGAAALAVDDTAYLFAVALGAMALAAEALQSSPDYYHPAIHLAKHHPGQIAVAERMSSLLFGSRLAVPLDEIRSRVAAAEAAANTEHHSVRATESIQSPYSLRCIPQGLGPMLESLDQARTVVEREANSVNDNPLIDPDAYAVHHTGNFYGAHIARAMDGLKLDVVNLANWQHSVMALLMDDRFSNGLAPSLSPHPGLSQGLKGLQIVSTSLVTAMRHWAAPSLIHTLPTEQFNQDIVSLGTHAAFTLADMIRLLRPLTAMSLIAAAQAVDLRCGAEKLGAGTGPLYRAIRETSPFVDEDRALDAEIELLCERMDARKLPALR